MYGCVNEDKSLVLCELKPFRIRIFSDNFWNKMATSFFDLFKVSKHSFKKQSSKKQSSMCCLKHKRIV